MGETTTPQANCTFGVRRSAFGVLQNTPAGSDGYHSLRQRPHYLDKVENAANPSWKRGFSETLFKTGGIWKRRLSSPCGRKHFENGAFWEWNFLKTPDGVMLIKWFPWPTSPKTQIQNFSGVVWTQNIWCVFRVKTPFSNFFGVVQTGSDTASLKRQFFLDHVYLAEICYLCMHQAVPPVPITFHLHTMVRPCQPRSSLWLLIVLLDKFAWLGLLWDPTFNQAGS